jgi:hypothetical protein
MENPNAESLDMLLAQTDAGKLIVLRVQHLLLCLFSSDAHLPYGNLKRKAEAIRRHLDEPLKQVAK